MHNCARAIIDFYPPDDGILESCLAESAAVAGGPEACVEAELDPVVVEYLHDGAEGLEGMTVESPTGSDKTHNMEDAMFTMTMDPADKIDANIETFTYESFRRLHEKRRRLQG